MIKNVLGELVTSQIYVSTLTAGEFTATQVETWQATRKTAIEPVFDLLSKLLSITGAHKPLPLRGVAYVSTFLGIGILLLQLAMLMNVRCGLPTRNVTHIKTVFR